jgi:Ca2+-transporting ATPase
MASYYNQSVEEVIREVKTSADGLSSPRARERLIHHGPNELEEKKKTPPWLLFLGQFRDFMILILVVAAALSGFMGDLTDTIIILVIIILNAVVGFVQEYRAEKAMDALKKMAVTQTQVLRDGKPVVIPARELVTGDLVLLEAGNVVPADIRLVEAHSLRADESSLTGESVPADKKNYVLTGENIPPGDQVNMLFKGTLIVNGRARGLVTETGMRTELGKIAGMLQEEEPLTPLQVRMQQFGKSLSWIILLICLILFVTGVLRGEDPFRILLLSVSLAVAAIPEALPALITVALSRGASRLARKNALVRKLPAVETLGSVTYICSDKTGTLTQNRMTVTALYEHPAPELTPGWSAIQMGMALNHDIQFNFAQEPFGESTELALVNRVIGDNSFKKYTEVAERFPRVAELPFDSDRKCMTTVHHLDGKFLIITKGAAESVAQALSSSSDADILRIMSDEWAEKGIRVLAYAFRITDRLPEPFSYAEVEMELTLAGLAGLIDPARDEVKESVRICRSAGIKPVMITGDHPATANAIAREIGILTDSGLTATGRELQHMDDETFLGLVEQISVYARVSPDQKLRIVRALQQKGHYVAMTGDGVNDAPSLKAANIGVAMGINGTDVSKEAAHLILLDDNFSTIVRAVREGRRIFDNIRKFVKYIMTCNSAEIWAIFMAPLLGMPIPLLPIHILWINLVTDGLPALALAGEQADRDIMHRPPRSPRESLFSDGVGLHILWMGLLMAGVTLGVQAWALKEGLEHWQTMVFTVLSLSQLAHVMGIRSERTYLFKKGIFSNRPLIITVLATFALQMAVIYLPFMNEILKTQPLSLKELIVSTGLALVVFHAVELEKFIRRLRSGKGERHHLQKRRHRQA